MAFINDKNLIAASLDGRTFRGMPGYVNTAEAQLAVIEGLLTSYEVMRRPDDLQLALRYLRAGLSSIFEKRATDDPLSSVATAVSLTNRPAVKIEYGIAATAVAGVVTVNRTALQVYRVLSTGSVLRWQHPFADLTSGTSYGVKTWTATGNTTTIQLDSAVSGPVTVILGTASAINVPVGVEVDAWVNYSQVVRRDTWTNPATVARANRVLNAAAIYTGDTQWSRLATTVANGFLEDAQTLKNAVLLTKTWSDTPLSTYGHTFTSDRLPAPSLSIDPDGCTVISALTASTPGSFKLRCAAAVQVTLAPADEVRYVISANTQIDAVIRLEGVSGTKYAANVELGLNPVEVSVSVSAFTPAIAEPIVAFEIEHTGSVPVVINAADVYIHRAGVTATLSSVPYQERIRGNAASWQGPARIADQPVGLLNTLGVNTDAMVQLIRNAANGNGWFRQFYYPARTDSIVYATPNTYGFDGPAGYSNNGDLQYLTALTLATVDTSLSTEVSTAFSWLSSDVTWLSMHPDHSDAWVDTSHSCAVLDPEAFTAPSTPPMGPPTDFTQSTYSIEYADPGMIATVLRLLVRVDNLERPTGAGNIGIKVSAVLSKCIAALDRLHHATGTMQGTFSPSGRQWHGVWHGEITQALSVLFAWATSGRVNMPELVERCQRWVTGLNTYLLRNTEFTEVAAVSWPHQPNWRDRVTESFIFSTKTVASRTGREQRVAYRGRPRRRVEYQHTGFAGKSAAARAALQASLNKPFFTPDWHLTTAVGIEVLQGVSELPCVESPDPSILANSHVYLFDADGGETLRVGYRDGNTLYLVDAVQRKYPRDCKVAPATVSAFNDQNPTQWLTDSTTQSMVGYDVLPQHDTRVLPDRPDDIWMTYQADMADVWAANIRSCAALEIRIKAFPQPEIFSLPIRHFTAHGETLEVVSHRHNWRDPIETSVGWTYDKVSTEDGPVLMLDGHTEATTSFGRAWTAFSKDQITDMLSTIKRTNGTQKPFWLDGVTNDLYPTGPQTLTNQIEVRPSEVIDSGILSRDYVAIAITAKDDRKAYALVQSVTEGLTSVILHLDRALPAAFEVDSESRVTTVYRVKMTGDIAAVSWISHEMAEIRTNMTTVQALNDN